MDYQYQNDQGFPDNNPSPSNHPFRRPDGNTYETVALILGFAGFLLMLAGCCCNVYILLFSVVADIAAIAVAIISRQTTGGRLTSNAKHALVLATIALVLAFATAMLYSSIIHNEALMAELQRIYEELGYELP